MPSKRRAAIRFATHDMTALPERIDKLKAVAVSTLRNVLGDRAVMSDVGELQMQPMSVPREMMETLRCMCTTPW